MSEKLARSLGTGWRDPHDVVDGERSMAELVDGDHDDPPPAEEAAAPLPFSFRTATAAYILGAPPGSSLDMLVSTAIRLGLTTKRLPDGRYRLTGASTSVVPFAEWIATQWAHLDGYACAIETPTGVTFDFDRAVAPRPTRTVEISGDAHAHVHVRLAVDFGLTVTPGASVWRFKAAGRTSALVAWLAAALKVDRDEAMRRMGVDQATVDKEDRESIEPLQVKVDLPPRRIESTITRDHHVDITSVVQRETTETELKCTSLYEHRRPAC